ncbi:MAG: phage portal protein, partial [Leucobacter sp.]|nr:phage portal protein [Leucobacter sp.]
NTTVGQWEAAKLDVFTEVIEKAVGHIAAQTRTPPHYLVANKGLSNLSGDALKAAETGLVQKVRQAMEFFDPRLRDVFQLIALQLGEDKAASMAPLGSIEWRDPENRSDAQTSDAAMKDRSMGYPFEYILKKRGHSPQEREEIMEMLRREQRELLHDPGLDAALRPFGGVNVDATGDDSAV